MSNQFVRKAERKEKMEERIKKLKEDIKELEKEAQMEVGKYVLKKWDVEDDKERLFKVIDELTPQANNLLNEGDSLGKYETEETQRIHSR